MSERCPTCGSENRSDCTLRLIGFPTSMCCIHPWHSGAASVSAPTTQWPKIPDYLHNPIVFRDKNIGLALVANWGSLNSDQWIFREHEGGWVSVRKVDVHDPLFIDPLNLPESEVSAPAPTPTNERPKAPKIANDPTYGRFRAEICDEYIAAGKPMPEKNWLYKKLIMARMGVAASEVQTAPKDTEWIKKTAEELDDVYMDHVGERALSVTLVEQIIERNYRTFLTASGVQTADERAEFEKWARLNLGRFPTLYDLADPVRLGPDDEYMEDIIEFAWQAARALSGTKEKS